MDSIQSLMCSLANGWLIRFIFGVSEKICMHRNFDLNVSLNFLFCCYNFLKIFF